MLDRKTTAQKLVWCLIGLAALVAVANVVLAIATGRSHGDMFVIRVFFACLGSIIVLTGIKDIITGVSGFRDGQGPIQRAEHPVTFWIFTGWIIFVGLAFGLVPLFVKG